MTNESKLLHDHLPSTIGLELHLQTGASRLCTAGPIDTWVCGYELYGIGLVELAQAAWQWHCLITELASKCVHSFHTVHSTVKLQGR